MEQFLNILLGAAIASIVPIVTLVLGQRRWRSEKKIELLRAKHDRLELMYSDILSRMHDPIVNSVWPSDITSKISVYGSKEVRKIYFDHIEDKEKDDSKKKLFYLDLSNACNRHLHEVQDELEAQL
ncbi:hypothetical protein [Idiomarina abyssalis]|uniref:hypothetical protein n=1 Tax=Idiomarina abyssalis TaxID=86102 RepID=UPI0006C8A373|nr:hypothetical protein [Idiomarina abyssalis]KPD21743.1 hypothetical protein ADS78_06995 [Idiomarina abyssalis]SFT77023.1 hypothetical protein SAMN04515657_2107 [Idiomarina abyssalis]